MKKLLYLIFLTFSLTCLVACGDDDDNDDGGGTSTSKFDDWNDPKSPNYKPEGYNPIAGEWHHKSSTVTKYLFTEDFKIYGSSLQDNGTWLMTSVKATYKINNEKFVTSSGLINFGGGGTVFEYQLYEEDGKETLLIYNYYKYYRVTQ